MAVPKPILFAVAVALCLVAGGFLLLGKTTSVTSDHAEDSEAMTVSVAPPAPEAEPAQDLTLQDVETTGALPAPAAPQLAPTQDAAALSEPALPGTAGAAPAQEPPSGEILVSKVPVDVLAGPSTDASAIYGFPAGRPFRVIGREAGFVKIVDVRSGAGGWIEEASLTPAKRAKPAPVAAATPSSSPKPKASSPRKPAPKAAAKPQPAPKKTATDTSEPAAKPTQTRGGGLFGLRRNNGNGNPGGLGGILQGAFGNR